MPPMDQAAVPTEPVKENMVDVCMRRMRRLASAQPGTNYAPLAQARAALPIAERQGADQEASSGH